ncbi:beta-taxilin [Syngnathoides biaculeatus]|uniref:beta-taxilin n=1 Tax=Syngnathoides biaculeatus TaxID=300417 RepID=UPI002ADE3AB3|nr:beta-taxilin [Syngnathoides biaculeatus]XP_061667908.1 beta-taxilin [Syngnathoides biaculeatus]XP_061667909.1 beta-taxilin [Syngnathoides biaculeatus]
METSPKASGVLAEVAPPRDERMDEFSRRLKEILGSDAPVEADAHDDITASVQSEICWVADSLSALSSPEEKLDHLMRKHAELMLRERGEERMLQDLRDNICVLRAERSKLASLCRDVQDHYYTLREDALRRCQEDEEKRSEMAAHFQTSLAEIQTQIEQHSARNEKLCEDNAKLSEKLHSLLEQCQRREESLEKVNHHHNLQQQLTSAKLDQANALLADAEQKHRREKEYLLAEALDKTRKCFAMKEEELSMKKKLALYSKKFDEFQTTLAKSNEIYARFKNEMENMSVKMKTLEKESNVWKLRFENCNRALTDLLEERSEKGEEYKVFVVTIRKLEKLCRALQDERKVLYAKIKDVRRGDADAGPEEPSAQEKRDDGDGLMTEEMRRLSAEQVKLQEFEESLMASHGARQEQEADPSDLDDDLVATAFAHFHKTQPQERNRSSEVEVKPEVKPEPQSEPQVKQEQKPELNREPQSQPEIKLEPQEKLQLNSQPKSESKLEPPVESEPEAKQEPQSEPVTKPQPEVKLQQNSQPKSEPKLEPQVESEPEVKQEPKQEPRSEPEIKLEGEVKLQHNSQPKSESKPGPQVKSEAQVKAEVLVKPKSDSKPELKSGPEVKPEQQSKSEPEAGSKPKVKPNSQSSSQVSTDVKLLSSPGDCQCDAQATSETTPSPPPKKETKKKKKKCNNSNNEGSLRP